VTPAEVDEAIFRRMVELRLTFPRRPELAFEEVEPARTIMAELDRVARPMEQPGYRGQREVCRRTGSLQQAAARLVQALGEATAAGNLRAGP